MFSFKVFLQFQVRVTGEEAAKKECILAKCGKISNAQAAGLAVTTVLNNCSVKVVPAVRKICDSYHEKVVPTIRKSCDNYHETAVCFGQKTMRSDG